MIRLPDHVPSVEPRRARDELSAAWGRLVATAEHEARQVQRASRHRSALARRRATAVRRAAQGQLPESPWRLLGIGLAAGVVIGAVGATVLNRRGRTTEQDEGPAAEHTTVSAVRERAASAVAGVREQASTAMHGATSAAKGAAAAARGTVGKVREKIGGDDDPEAGPATAPQPGPAS